MKSTLKLIVVAAMGAMAACSSQPKAPDVSQTIRTGLDQAGLKDVSESQDRTKGVVTLAGNVATTGEKVQAEAIARQYAGNQVVANQIAVLPNSADRRIVKDENSDFDKGIQANLDAALLQSGLKDGVSYGVKNGVVTLTGSVRTQGQRATVEQTAAGVPNVQQVVNELQVKNQPATSTR